MAAPTTLEAPLVALPTTPEAELLAIEAIDEAPLAWLAALLDTPPIADEALAVAESERRNRTVKSGQHANHSQISTYRLHSRRSEMLLQRPKRSRTTPTPKSCSIRPRQTKLKTRVGKWRMRPSW